MNKNIAERLKSASLTIGECCKQFGRQPDEVALLAVSKTKPIADIESAYEAGQRLFGENYVQEGVEKIQQLQHLPDIEWHFIGPLQSNKSKLVAEHFDWVQSVDRLKIAKRLSDQRPAHKSSLNLLLQVNINRESTKSGVESQTELEELASQIAELPNVTLRGIMAIPAAEQSDGELRATFTQLHDWFVSLKNTYNHIDTLSLGMSADMAVAISSGSTMVRLGTAIFGPRVKK